MEISTPRGKVIITKGGKARLKFNQGFQGKANRELAKGGRLQKFVDSEVLRGCEPYIPMRSGMAKKSGILHTLIGTGIVKWSTPYIRYIYFGWVMTGNAPKKVTSIPLQYHGGGKRGRLWCERYKADNLTKLRGQVGRKLKQGWN
jgi:hypothetical protein